MSGEIAKIEERHKLANLFRGNPGMLCPQTHDDRGVLLAEVKRLTRERDEARAEVERVKREHGVDLSRLDEYRMRAGVAERDLDAARGEIKRLRAERDTLLLDAREVVRWCLKPTFPPWCAIHDRVNAHADTLAALDAAAAKLGKESRR